MTKYKNTFRIESARLQDWDYSTPWRYYVTICTKNHIQYFGKIINGKMILNSLGKIAEKEWAKTKLIRLNVELDRYVIMPNHIHGIIVINGADIIETHRVCRGKENDICFENENVNKGGDAFDASLRISNNCLSDIVRGFKSSFTKQAKENGFNNFKWQPRFYDRIIRNEKELFNIRNYIEQNPAKWALEKHGIQNQTEL